MQRIADACARRPARRRRRQRPPTAKAPRADGEEIDAARLHLLGDRRAGRARSGSGSATSTRLPRWHPRIRDSRIENGEPSDRVGCVRDFHLQNGDRIRERLLGLSDYDMFCTYAILESPMPLTDYVATLRLTPVTDGDRTFAEWTAEFDCAEADAEGLVNGIGTDVFQAGFDRAQAADGGLSMVKVVKSTILDAPGRGGLGGAARFQRPRPMAPGRRRQRDRPGPAVGQGRLRAPLPSGGRVGTARAAADAVGCGHGVQLLPAGDAGAASELRRACAARAGHRRRP